KELPDIGRPAAETVAADGIVAISRPVQRVESAACGIAPVVAIIRRDERSVVPEVGLPVERRRIFGAEAFFDRGPVFIFAGTRVHFEPPAADARTQEPPGRNAERGRG